jgi:hypothetical protein
MVWSNNSDCFFPSIVQAVAGVPVGQSIDNDALGCVVYFKEGMKSTHLPAVAAQTFLASHIYHLRVLHPRR